jgi:hypothetical protein
MRYFSDPLILSTLPHFLICVPALTISYPYAIVIALSSTFSIMWHRHGEPMYTPLFYADYGFAGLWTAFDFYLAFQTYSCLFTVLVLNLLALSTNCLPIKQIHYRSYHSLWHLFSAIKGLLVCAFISSGRL